VQQAQLVALFYSPWAATAAACILGHECIAHLQNKAGATRSLYAPLGQTLMLSALTFLFMYHMQDLLLNQTKLEPVIGFLSFLTSLLVPLELDPI
jgi:hypothetical protein